MPRRVARSGRYGRRTERGATFSFAAPSQGGRRALELDRRNPSPAGRRPPGRPRAASGRTAPARRARKSSASGSPGDALLEHRAREIDLAAGVEQRGVLGTSHNPGLAATTSNADCPGEAHSIMLASATVMSFAIGSSGRRSPGRATRPAAWAATSCADVGRGGDAGRASGFGGAGFLAVGLEKKPIGRKARQGAGSVRSGRPSPAAGCIRTSIMFPS